MSSILKALKKIESETSDTRIPTWPYHINNRTTIARRIKLSSQRNQLFSMLLVICVLALVGKTLVGLNLFEEKRVPSAPSIQHHPSPAVVPDGHAVKVPSIKPPSPQSSVLSNGAVKPVTPKRTSTIKAKPKAIAKAMNTPIADTPPQKQPPEMSLETATHDNTGLRLQALVWSVTPKDRFAVINNRILHEGDRVEQAVLVEIKRDFVVVEVTGKRWKLEHALR